MVYFCVFNVCVLCEKLARAWKGTTMGYDMELVSLPLVRFDIVPAFLFLCNLGSTSHLTPCLSWFCRFLEEKWESQVL